jgi:nucleoside-diphosphate-sugar epimerase
MSVKLVVGCGYLGLHVARQWQEAGHRVVAITRSAERAEDLRCLGIEPLVADITRPETLAQLPVAKTVLYCVGYDRHGVGSRWDIQVQGLRNVLDALSAATERILYISSTSVYGNAGGDWVHEESPCRPAREAGKVLLAAEELVRGNPLGNRAIILRLAGIYGPGRLPHLADMVAGKPMAIPSGGWLNLIHVEDAASVVLAAEARSTVPRLYVVSDGHPTNRRDFYRCLAELLKLPDPKFVDSHVSESASTRSVDQKRVDNARMLKDLGIRLKYPSFREGLVSVARAKS